MEKVGERMADISTEELERIEREYHSGSDNIKPIQEFSKPEDLYDELIASIRKYHPSTDITLIEKAYHVAFEAHKGQVRKSGEHILSIRSVWQSFWQSWNWTRKPLLRVCCMMCWKIP